MNAMMIREKAIAGSLGYDLVASLRINETKTPMAIADYLLTDALALFRQGRIGAARRLVTLYNDDVYPELLPVYQERYGDFILFKFV